MPTPPPTNSSSSRATSAAKPKAHARKKPSVAAGADDAVLVDKSLQKTTRKAAAVKTAVKPPKDLQSSFEKPAEAEWHRMISEAAYYRAERRGFQPGYEHEDWAWAEEAVRKVLSP